MLATLDRMQRSQQRARCKRRAHRNDRIHEIRVACAAVGLLIAVVFKMITPLIEERDGAGLVMLAAVFVAIGFLRLPLQIVLLVAIPVSLAVTIFQRRPKA